MAFEREAPNSRYVDTRRGDTLRRIALRELGSAERWVELALLNGLRPPYIVDEASSRGAGVLLAGEPIRVPSATDYVSAETAAAEVFGTDLHLNKGRLQVAAGDLELVSGAENFKQAILTRLRVTKGELMFHADYGNHAPRLIGRGNGPTTGRLAAFYVRSAILEDARVSAVPRCTARVIGDQMHVSAEVTPITGRTFTLNEVL